jgi:hypothetical protein
MLDGQEIVRRIPRMTGMMNRRELLASLGALGVVAFPASATGQTRGLNILWRNARAEGN